MTTLNRSIERGKARPSVLFARHRAGLLFVLPSVLFMGVFFTASFRQRKQLITASKMRMILSIDFWAALV